MGNTKVQLSAMGDDGKPVDWWFIYKIAGKSAAINGKKPKGSEYLYYDSSGPTDKDLDLSKNQITDPKNGAVSNTLNQIYNNLSDPDMGWYFYNDEDPISGKTNGIRGHTKGVICFNLKTNAAFWLIHSAPKFPLRGKYSFPATAMKMAQTFLCITLKNADTATAIAAQQYVAQQPNVYLASKVPAALKATDPRALLINNKITPAKTAYAKFIPFQSKKGQTFKSFAKNKFWDTKGDDDFYNDLVGPALAETLDVETWTHGLTPGSSDFGDKVHTIQEMKTVNIGPLGIKPPWEWSEENDHAKLAVSAANEKLRFICVGDINFTKTMESRSGGTAAFMCDDLVKDLDKMLSDVTLRTSNPRSVSQKKVTKVKKAPAKKAVKKKAPVKKIVAKKPKAKAHQQM